MKYFTGLTIFKYTWDQVAAGFWSRYPNPHRWITIYIVQYEPFSQKIVLVQNSSANLTDVNPS